MRTYLIRLNGAPFFEVTVPSYMDPVLAARDVLLRGQPDDSAVTVNWSPAARLEQG